MSAQIIENNSFFNNHSEVPECPSDNESVSSNKQFLPQQKANSTAPAAEGAYILLNNSSISELPKQDQDKKSSQLKKSPVTSKIVNKLQKMTARIINITKLLLKKEEKKSNLRVSFELIGLQLVKKAFQSIKTDTNKQEAALYRELADINNSIGKLKEIDNNFILSGSAYQKDFLVYGKVNQLISARNVNSQNSKGPFTFAKIAIAPKSFMRNNELEFPLVSGLKVAETATIFPTSIKGAALRGLSTIYLSPLFPLVQLNFDKFTVYRPGDAIFVFGKKLTNTSFLATTLFKDFNLSPFYKAANKLSSKSTLFQVLITATVACIGIKVAIMIKKSFDNWINELEKNESKK